jgi:hypothetical protein
MQLPDGGGGECSADYMGGDPLEGVAKMCLCVPRTLRSLSVEHGCVAHDRCSPSAQSR